MYSENVSNFKINLLTLYTIKRVTRAPITRAPITRATKMCKNFNQ